MERESRLTLLQCPEAQGILAILSVSQMTGCEVQWLIERKGHSQFVPAFHISSVMLAIFLKQEG